MVIPDRAVIFTKLIGSRTRKCPATGSLDFVIKKQAVETISCTDRRLCSVISDWTKLDEEQDTLKNE
jgi:hypothetical protein